MARQRTQTFKLFSTEREYHEIPSKHQARNETPSVHCTTTKAETLLQKPHWEPTKRENKEEEKEGKRKKNLTGKSCHQGGASSVARSTDWWHKHPVGALLCRAVEPARKKNIDYLITWKILGIEYKILSVVY